MSALCGHSCRSVTPHHAGRDTPLAWRQCGTCGGAVSSEGLFGGHDGTNVVQHDLADSIDKAATPFRDLLAHAALEAATEGVAPRSYEPQ